MEVGADAVAMVHLIRTPSLAESRAFTQTQPAVEDARDAGDDPHQLYQQRCHAGGKPQVRAEWASGLRSTGRELYCESIGEYVE